LKLLTAIESKLEQFKIDKIQSLDGGSLLKSSQFFISAGRIEILKTYECKKNKLQMIKKKQFDRFCESQLRFLEDTFNLIQKSTSRVEVLMGQFSWREAIVTANLGELVAVKHVFGLSENLNESKVNTQKNPVTLISIWEDRFRPAQTKGI